MGLVIGLHGAKGVGKDYFYQVVKEAFPKLSIRKIAYADPIKQQVCHIFKLNTEQEYDRLKREYIECFSLGFRPPFADLSYDDLNYDNPHFVDGRRVVREIGMLMRNYDERQFVRYVEDEITKDPGSIWCITDLRFKNELRSVKRLIDGVVVKILRPSHPYDGHASETEITDKQCDIIIKNNGTIEEYKQQVIKEFSALLEKGTYSTFR